eukprot:CAMPEP_0172697480 /NCGR_PEP_ID=MMETSP1074-20121228/28800_1 /TAXON_ID=2916 /ORGANISM="Ceratium fusus, Strain PA161109" /LENGTH=340 /DNA_ID=CAMNT_0013518401 /DNA_START=44 /DNA_END=1066 /DNA_ORIENTATION=-
MGCCGSTNTRIVPLEGAYATTKLERRLSQFRSQKGQSVGLPTLDVRDVEISDKVGAGSYGVTFKGTWCGFPVALKFLSTDAAAMALPQDVEGLKRECNHLHTLRHPNVMRVYGIVEGTLPGTWPHHVQLPCMCCELLSGGTLLEFLQTNHGKGRNPQNYWTKACGMLVGAASGLAFLHNSGVMHRDIKSSNVMLDCHGSAKLIDFGMVKQQEAGLKFGEKRSQTKNIGTYTHKAPEVMLGTYGYDADVFSFGIVISEVFVADDAEDIIEQTRTRDFGLDAQGLRSMLDSDSYYTGCHAFVDLAVQCCSLETLQRPSAAQLHMQLEGIQHALLSQCEAQHM